VCNEPLDDARSAGRPHHRREGVLRVAVRRETLADDLEVVNLEVVVRRDLNVGGRTALIDGNVLDQQPVSAVQCQQLVVEPVRDGERDIAFPDDSEVIVAADCVLSGELVGSRRELEQRVAAGGRLEFAVTRLVAVRITAGVIDHIDDGVEADPVTRGRRCPLPSEQRYRRHGRSGGLQIRTAVCSNALVCAIAITLCSVARHHLFISHS